MIIDYHITTKRCHIVITNYHTVITSNTKSNMRKTLKQVYDLHPGRQAMKVRFAKLYETTEQTMYRQIRSGILAGRAGAIDILYKEFAVRVDSVTGWSIDYTRLQQIEDAKHQIEMFEE